MTAFHPTEGAWALPSGSVTQHRRSPEGCDVAGLSCVRKIHGHCCVCVLVLQEAVPPALYGRDGSSAQLTGWKADNLQPSFTAWSFVAEEWWLSFKASSDETDLLPLSFLGVPKAAWAVPEQSEQQSSSKRATARAAVGERKDQETLLAQESPCGFSILLLKGGRRRLWLFFGTRTTLWSSPNMSDLLLHSKPRVKGASCAPPAWLLLLGGFPQSRAEPQLQLRWVAALTRLLQV